MEPWFVGYHQVLGALFACTTVGYLFVLARMFTYLERHDPQTYERLGKPTLFLNNTLANGVRVTRFLLMREYSTSLNARLRLLATLARWAFIVGLLLAMAIMVLSVLAT